MLLPVKMQLQLQGSIYILGSMFGPMADVSIPEPPNGMIAAQRIGNVTLYETGSSVCLANQTNGAITADSWLGLLYA